MRRRDEKMNELKQAVLAKLATVSSSPQYPQLMRFLIAQGLMTLLENSVTLQVRKEDLAIARKELPEAVRLFQDTMEKSSGVRPTVNVAIDEKDFLPAAPQPGREGASSTGGVLLSARNGQILCRNTLDHRLTLAFDALKPTLRGTLFGVREKIEVVQAKKKHGGVSLPK
jgi:V-type H+-transporting ATPase subunit E